MPDESVVVANLLSLVTLVMVAMNATNFNTIPTGTELGDVVRDLRFHPSPTTHPAVLSAEQIRHFNERGYVMPLRFFCPAEMDEIRGSFDELLARYLGFADQSADRRRRA